MSAASSGASTMVASRLARLRSLLMNERASSVRNCIDSPRATPRHERHASAGAVAASAVAASVEGWRTSLINRQASYLSLQKSGE